MTLDEAIKVLRQHNVTGASVLRITRGQALEKDLLAQVLDSCEQFISEKVEYKRLLKVAVEDFKILGNMLEDEYGNCTAEICCDECVLGGENLADDCQWRHSAEVLKLIGKVDDNVHQDRCSNYMDRDGKCFIDDTPCDCGGNIEKCKGR